MRGMTGTGEQHSAADDEEGPEEYWGAHAAEYNEFIVRVVPRYAEMLRLLLEYLPAAADRVLELGTGTGNVSLELAARWPNAHFTFVDAAPEMLDIMRGRLRAKAPAVAARASFRAQRFEELQLDAGSVDVAVASLSLHHVEDIGAVYDRLAPALGRGGRLIMLDGLRGEAAVDHAVHMARWDAYWRSPGKLSEAELDDVVEHIERHDHYRTLNEHFALLRSAGFAYADCLWRDGLFTLLTAGI
jgi:ubiquinone/menaquinone biosynthesis C-methylase UbiE